MYVRGTWVMIRNGAKIRVERESTPLFTKVIEIVPPGIFYLYPDVAGAADAILEGREPDRELRWLGQSGRLFCMPLKRLRK